MSSLMSVISKLASRPMFRPSASVPDTIDHELHRDVALDHPDVEFHFIDLGEVGGVLAHFRRHCFQRRFVEVIARRAMPPTLSSLISAFCNTTSGKMSVANVVGLPRNDRSPPCRLSLYPARSVIDPGLVADLDVTNFLAGNAHLHVEAVRCHVGALHRDV